MQIQWFPGHMTKIRGLLLENLSLVDVVVELLDARIPLSSKNPDLDGMLKTKPKIIALNKSDLADPEISKNWSKWFSQKGYTNVFINSLNGTGIDQLKSTLRLIAKDKIDRQKEKGRIFAPVRAMIVGIPNVGKSSLINKIAGRSVTTVADRPGVTRGKQWVRLNEEIELLDTPGVLWPKFDDQKVGLNLACTGAIKDTVFDTVETAGWLLKRLSEKYPENIMARYKLKSVDDKPDYILLEETAKNRGCIISGGNPDLTRAAAMVLDEFRGGKIGKISLEEPL